MKLGCDCAVLFISQGVVEGVKKRGEKTSQNINHQDLVLGRVYMMHYTFGSLWIDHQQTIDLLDWPFDMENRVMLESK